MRSLGLWIVIAVGALGVAGCVKSGLKQCGSDGECARFNATCQRGYCVVGDGGIIPKTCMSSKDCPDNAPICAAGMCTTCKDGDGRICAERNPMTPLCQVSSGPDFGRCVECLGDGDCTKSSQVCHLDNHTCGGCTQHSQCPGKVCANGLCPSNVLVVDNNGACAADGDASGGTTTKPFCEVQSALHKVMNDGASTAYLRVAGSNNNYRAFSISGNGPFSAYVVGPGRNAVPPATISAAAPAPAASVSTQATSTLFIDGLAFVGNNGAQVVQCVGPSTSPMNLTVVNSSIINGVNAEGVQASKCNLTLDSDLIGRSTGGITVTDSKANITNCLIYDIFTAPGVSFKNAGAGTVFAFNTVTGNNAAAGVSCDSASPQVFASLVVNNKAPQIATCAAALSFTDSTKVMFDNNPTGVPYTLNPNKGTNSDAVVDKVPCDSKITDHDILGNPRPAITGGQCDIGAQELK